jgi:hypothetical protein
MIINKQSREIICTKQTCGSVHDFQVFKQTGCQIAQATCLLGDSGYQGLQGEHQNSQTPAKKPKGGELTAEQKQANRELSRRRIVVENVIRHVKIFRIMSERYRNRRRRFGLRFNLIAGLYNYELTH